MHHSVAKCPIHTLVAADRFVQCIRHPDSGLMRGGLTGRTMSTAITPSHPAEAGPCLWLTQKLFQIRMIRWPRRIKRARYSRWEEAIPRYNGRPSSNGALSMLWSRLRLGAEATTRL